MHGEKVNNHYYPRFSIKKWIKNNGKIYDKSNDFIRNIERLDFSEKHYYSDDGTDNLERRIEVFEAYIGNLIKNIDEESNRIFLTGKELFFLKLYLLLSTYRHNHTTEVIKIDDSGIYRSNNYLFGVKRIQSKSDFLKSTRNVMDLFEKVKNDTDFKHLENFTRYIYSRKYPEAYMLNGMHLAILKNDSVEFCVSDICTIIENDMDGNFLYAMIPVTPFRAICLVKTKYYLNVQTYFYTLDRFEQINGIRDPYLSTVFKHKEIALYCTYYKPYVKSNVHAVQKYSKERDTYYGLPLYYKYSVLPNGDYSSNELIFFPLDDNIVNYFNAIHYQDGNIIMFCKELTLNNAKNTKLYGRKITMDF